MDEGELRPDRVEAVEHAGRIHRCTAPRRGRGGLRLRPTDPATLASRAAVSRAIMSPRGPGVAPSATRSRSRRPAGPQAEPARTPRPRSTRHVAMRGAQPGHLLPAAAQMLDHVPARRTDVQAVGRPVCCVRRTRRSPGPAPPLPAPPERRPSPPPSPAMTRAVTFAMSANTRALADPQARARRTASSARGGPDGTPPHISVARRARPLPARTPRSPGTPRQPHSRPGVVDSGGRPTSLHLASGPPADMQLGGEQGLQIPVDLERAGHRRRPVLPRAVQTARLRRWMRRTSRSWTGPGLAPAATGPGPGAAAAASRRRRRPGRRRRRRAAPTGRPAAGARPGSDGRQGRRPARHPFRPRFTAGSNAAANAACSAARSSGKSACSSTSASSGCTNQ